MFIIFDCQNMVEVNETVHNFKNQTRTQKIITDLKDITLDPQNKWIIQPVHVLLDRAGLEHMFSKHMNGAHPTLRGPPIYKKL